MPSTRGAFRPDVAAPTPALVVFAGLPGVGKTTLARAAAGGLGATYLRVDTVEQALRDAGTLPGDVAAEGYVVAYRVAADNLALGRSVVADQVNPLTVTRDAWRAVADATGARLVDVEVVCSDPAEHRRRVEARVSDIPGLALPTWGDVRARAYDAWDRPRLVLDTAGVDVGACVAALLAHVGSAP